MGEPSSSPSPSPSPTPAPAPLPSDFKTKRPSPISTQNLPATGLASASASSPILLASPGTAAHSPMSLPPSPSPLRPTTPAGLAAERRLAALAAKFDDE